MNGSSCNTSLDVGETEKQIRFDVNLHPVPRKANKSY